MVLHNSWIEDLRKKYYPFYKKDTDIFYNEYARIIANSLNNYLDEIDKSLGRFLEKNGNNEDLLYIKDYKIKSKLYCISSDLRVDLRTLINAIYYSAIKEIQKEFRKEIEKEIEKAKFDSAIFFCRNFRRHRRKIRVNLSSKNLTH